LNELDKYVEDSLIPAYMKGRRRKDNPEYSAISYQIWAAEKKGDTETVYRLRSERRKLMSVAAIDPDFRRLRYVRYADDFLLGFAGPKNEAKEIRQRLGEFLAQKLKLTLSEEKTLITHAVDEKAKFLGHEITVTREATCVSDNGRRATNGCIALLVPRLVVRKYMNSYSKKGKVVHRPDWLADTDYTIVQRYQAVLKGLYNFYCMATNVSKRMAYIKWILETSLTKTLASKFQVSVPVIYRKYQVCWLGKKELRVTKTRPGKDPLIAVFGGFPLERIKDGKGVVDIDRHQWRFPASKRSEVVQRLLAGKCELCEAKDVPVEVHHIRKLADIDRPGRRPKSDWDKLMAARKRKTLVVCESCHDDIHAGLYDGPRL
jgi:hypothetical protein